MTAARLDGERSGYIDKTGAWAIEPCYDFACPFAGGLAEVNLAARPGCSLGYIDQTGKVVWSTP